MNEKPYQVTPIDEVVFMRGSYHQAELQQIADKLKRSFNENELFSSKTQSELDTWAENNPNIIAKSLDEIYIQLRELKSTKAPGHEMSHLLDNVNSALRTIDEYDSISEAEKLEIVLSCLGHDLGRYVEEELNMIDHKDTEFLMPALVGKRMKAARALPEEIQKRILYNIATGSVPKTGHRTADIVHQADREQLLGSVLLARDLAFGAGVGNINLSLPVKEGLEKEIPLSEIDDYKEDWPFLLQKEFYMRNIYPVLSPEGQAVRDENMQENATLLLLATDGKSDAYEQVFAPELGLVNEQDLHTSKRSISKKIFRAALAEKQQFLEDSPEERADSAFVLKLIHDLFETDKIIPPSNFDEIMIDKLDASTEADRNNLSNMIRFSLLKRHEQRKKRLTLLKKYTESDGISHQIAQWIIDELESREDIYNMQ